MSKSLVHTFTACCLDYCNSLFSSIMDSLFRRAVAVSSVSTHGWCWHMYRTSDEHPAWRQELHCRRSTGFEHSEFNQPDTELETFCGC